MPRCRSVSPPYGVARLRPHGQRGDGMKQVVQPVSGAGPVEVLDVPRPVISPTEVLVRTVASVISPGTERAVTALAQVQPARQGARPAGPGPPGRAQGPGRGHLGHDAGGPEPTRYRPAARLLRGRAGGRGRRRRRRDQGRPAGGDRRRRQGQSRRVPGRAGPAVRGRAGPGAAGGRGVRHPRVHTAARAAPVRGRPGLEGRGARPRADRPARGPAGDGLRMRRGRDRPGRICQECRGRRRVPGLGRVR